MFVVNGDAGWSAIDVVWCATDSDQWRCSMSISETDQKADRCVEEIDCPLADHLLADQEDEWPRNVDGEAAANRPKRLWSSAGGPIGRLLAGLEEIW